MIHYHVASGLAGYGPDSDENTPTFASLGEALEYAREELSTFADMAHETASGLALHASQYHAAFKLDPSREDMRAMALDHYADAWKELERVEALELLRANLALQESQAAEFPVDVSHNTRLYLWVCDETECESEES